MAVSRFSASPVTAGRQQGVVIIVALVILVTITIIAVTSMSTSGLEEKMASNYRDREIAFQAAEAALRAGERDVEGNLNLAAFDEACTNGLCKADDCTTDPCPRYWLQENTWSTDAKHRTYNVTFAEVAAPAKYIIEFVTTIPLIPGTPDPATDPRMFRITALGTGSSPHSRVMLQSTYKVN